MPCASLTVTSILHLFFISLILVFSTKHAFGWYSYLAYPRQLLYLEYAFTIRYLGYVYFNTVSRILKYEVDSRHTITQYAKHNILYTFGHVQKSRNPLLQYYSCCNMFQTFDSFRCSADHSNAECAKSAVMPCSRVLIGISTGGNYEQNDQVPLVTQRSVCTCRDTCNKGETIEINLVIQNSFKAVHA